MKKKLRGSYYGLSCDICGCKSSHVEKREEKPLLALLFEMPLKRQHDGKCEKETAKQFLWKYDN